MKNKKDCNDDALLHTFLELNKEDNNSDKIISKSLIKDVVNNGQFAFLKYTIEQGMFEDIALKYFGKFKARHKMIRKMYNARQKQKKK